MKNTGSQAKGHSSDLVLETPVHVLRKGLKREGRVSCSRAAWSNQRDCSIISGGSPPLLKTPVWACRNQRGSGRRQKHQNESPMASNWWQNLSKMRSSQGLEALGKSFGTRFKEKATIESVYYLLCFKHIQLSPEGIFFFPWVSYVQPKAAPNTFLIQNGLGGSKKRAKWQNDGQNLPKRPPGG